MAQTYNMISIVAFSLGGISLVISIFFWFKFGIWNIIGDLSGRTARKSIEQMRADNERTGKKSYRPTPVALERGTVTEKVEPIIISTNVTEKLNEGTEVLGNATDILNEGTEVLSEGTVLLDEGIAFEMLQDIVLVHTNETI